ncbi:isochorismate synthase [Flavobacteriaceae bacterium UJ101]|nr:isochorismate synthase [Flavobacteriaceae bacterium UJ101]
MLVEEIQDNLDQDIPFVIYRKPNQREVLYIKEEKGTKSFIFSSFDQKQQLRILYQEAQIITISKQEVKKLQLSKTKFTNDNVKESVYQERIQDIIDYIQEGKADKIVFSRSILLEHQVDVLKTLNNLLDQYTNAFCYLWYHPETGMWLGATPETLTQIQGDCLNTMSLAGTKTPKQTWSVKEIQEQKVVSDYIKQQLEPFSKEIQVSEVQTIQSGAIEHLLTKISATLKNHHYKEVIEKIHPTPAVCGVPTEKAKAYIKEFEKYDRLFYTGFLGELNDDHVELYVNLRCAQLNATQVKLYVGGGINTLSNPQKEWQETQWKAQTIQKCLVIK